MSRLLFLSGHDKSLTGGNKRFERLAAYALENTDSIWLSIERSDLPVKSDRLIFLSRPRLPGYSLRLLYACIRDRKKIRLLGSLDKIIVFGETPLLAALFLAWYLKAELSVGVRSNVPKRHLLTLKTKNGFDLFNSKLRYALRDVVLRCVFKNSSTIIVQSPNAKSDFCRNYSVMLDRVFVLPNDLPTVSLKLKNEALHRRYKNKPVNILFVGNESSIKGFDNIIELISKIDFSRNNFKFTIVGIPQKFWLTSDNVVFIERSDNVFDLMLKSDLLVVPSREDQFPNVILEAMAVGLPVIGANVDGISYMIDDTRFLFDAGSTESFYDVLISLKNESRYDDLVKHTNKRAKLFCFEWEEKYISLVVDSKRCYVE